VEIILADLGTTRVFDMAQMSQKYAVENQENKWKRAPQFNDGYPSS